MTKKAKGGLTKGKSHKEGGIPMKVKSTGQNIEVEGGEIIINKYSSADTKLHDFDGKKMTKCEVASAINSADNNGVKIDCDTIVGRKYKYEEGGRIPLQNSLGIERQYLPQVRKKDYPEFFEMLSKDNISFQETMIDPLEYNPTQSYVKKDNIDEIYRQKKLKDKPLLVSSDGFVLDGHHRWYYATEEKMPSVKAIIINLPIYELIEKVNLFRMAEHQYNKGGKIDKKKYVSFFADTDGDGIPNVDDISPFNRDKKGQIEEVRVSDELEQIIDFRNKAEDVRFDTIEKLEKIAGTCGVGKDRCGILSRTKTPYSIINKMRRRSLTNTKDLEKLDIKAQELLQTGELSGLDLFKGLTDVVGTMVVVDTYDQLDRVSKEIEKGKIGKVLEYENFYDLPNGNNGYRAIHFIIGVKKDGVLIPVEVQIKTKRVKKLAEASHTAYKNGNLDNAKNDELGVMVMKADKGDEAIAKEIDPLIADTKKLKKELTMEKRKKGGLLDEYLAKGGSVDEETLVVDVVWRQLDEKGLGKFNLKESDVERLEDNYGSTYYFEIYDDTNEKPISYTKMKNILDKSMKEMGLMDSNFEKGGLVVGDYVNIVSDNEMYDDYRNERELMIESISDDGYGETMYELEDVPFSFYEYELEKVYAKGGKVDLDTWFVMLPLDTQLEITGMRYSPNADEYRKEALYTELENEFYRYPQNKRLAIYEKYKNVKSPYDYGFAKGGKIDTSKKGVYVYELKDGTFKVANNYGGRDFPYEFADVFPTKQRAMKFANKVAENSKSKVQVIKFEKGGKLKAKREINEGLKELEEALAGASKKHKAQSKMVGQIQKGFDETFAEGGMVSEAKAKSYFGYTDKEFNDLSEREKKRTREQVFRTIQEDLVQKKRAKFIKKRDKELYMDFNDYLAKGGKIKGRPTLKQMCNMYRNKR